MRIHALLFFFFSQAAFALYGGKTVPNQRFLVDLKVSGETFCQGVVIAADKILTSGHCIEVMGSRIGERSVYLTYYPQAVSVVQGSEKISAKTITLAPSYFDSPGLAAEDLALVELSRPLTRAEVLPFASKSEFLAGTNVILSANGKEAPTTVIRRMNGPDSTVIVTNGSRAGVCQGDSGGALIFLKDGKRYLAGIIASQSTGCVVQHSVSYYPRRNF